MRRFVLGSAALLAVVFAAPAMAQTTTTQTPANTTPATMPLEVERWTITPFIGAGFSGDLDNSPLNVGAALGYNVTPRVAVEGQFAYMGAQQGDIFQFDTNVYTLDANVLYHFTEQTGNRQWAPYLAAGLGMVHGSADLSNLDPTVASQLDDSSTNLAFNFGGGVKTALSDRVRLRGDLRYYAGGQDVAPSFWRASVGLGFVLSR